MTRYRCGGCGTDHAGLPAAYVGGQAVCVDVFERLHGRGILQPDTADRCEGCGQRATVPMGGLWFRCLQEGTR